jgi:hypothetical protein
MGAENNGSSGSKSWIWIVVILCMLIGFGCLCCLSSSSSFMLQGTSTTSTSEEDEEEMAGMGGGDGGGGDGDYNAEADNVDDSGEEDIGGGDDADAKDDKKDKKDKKDDKKDKGEIVTIYGSDKYKKKLAGFDKVGKYAFTGSRKKYNNLMGSIKIKKGYKVDLFNDTKFKDKLMNNLTKDTSTFKSKVKNKVGSISISKA